jgi:hypothetical protein
MNFKFGLPPNPPNLGEFQKNRSLLLTLWATQRSLELRLCPWSIQDGEGFADRRLQLGTGAILTCVGLSVDLDVPQWEKDA